jgi:hypothetical protein
MKSSLDIYALIGQFDRNALSFNRMLIFRFRVENR